MLKYFFEIDNPIANFCKRALRRFIHVFYVPKREPARILVKYRDRVLVGFSDPVNIHLHFYQIRIASDKQYFVRVFTILFYKLKIVVMVAKLYACLFTYLPGIV